MICDKEEKAAALLENKENGTTPTLSCLVLFNDFSELFAARAKACEVEVLKLEQLMVSREEVLYPCNADMVKMSALQGFTKKLTFLSTCQELGRQNLKDPVVSQNVSRYINPVHANLCLNTWMTVV